MRRVENLCDYLNRELVTLREQLEELKSNPAFETPANLPALTAEWTRSTKLLSMKVSEYHDRTVALDRNRNKGATLEDVMADEEEVSRMIDSVKSLDAKIKMFHLLPKDLAGARAKYYKLEGELNQLTQQRDSMFESLVER
jgi:HAUS augmin-like complex subunit 1